jgi:hypothetical protein
MCAEFRGEAGFCQDFHSSPVKKHCYLQIILETEETEVGRDPVRMSGNENARIEECGISDFSETVLRSGMSHSCVAKLQQKASSEFKLPVTRQVQEGSAVVFSAIVVM